MVKNSIFKLCTAKYIKYTTKKYIHNLCNKLCLLRFPIELQYNLNYIYMYSTSVCIYNVIYCVVHNLKIQLLTIQQYFIYHIRQGQ